MRLRIVQLIFFCMVYSMNSQQDSQFTQYMYNTITINPAYTASRDVMNIFTLHRAQWVGLEGSPSTSVVSLSAPVKGSNLGIGVSILNDRIGPSDETKLETDFSYTIRAFDDFQFAFGLKASIGFLNVDFSKLNQFNPGDYAFQDNIQNSFTPNVGAGLYLYSENTYFGVSVPNILETTYYNKYADAGSVSTAVQRAHVYLIAGKVFELNDAIKLKPSILTKIVNGSPLQVDVSVNTLFSNVLTLGLAYRYDAAVSALAGVQISDSWFIGYGYDMATTEIANYSYGTHEIFLRFELFKRYSGISSPRFF
ncbi:type IX secretion system membrane protein PorP/SprF [Maribacter sp. 2307UL18-2]|uniref:PorP/SprF family type IX secretion system membrane protein n=1 Tax=Maribacter sp. 2307UL18-2 TaxID=3386274 RepID=UPI0039BC4B3E